MKKFINIIGLMSGTSMDGINLSLVNTDGTILNTTKYNFIQNYSNKTYKLLNSAFENPKLFLSCPEKFEELSNLITLDHYKCVKTLLKKIKITPELIGFHGQTIYHNFKEKISVQLGNPQMLATLSNIDVVSDFRINDIESGGQGAPISPIYHEVIIKKSNLKLPCCVLNIGGVANITFFDGRKLIGFDVGPGNGLMDYYVKKNLGVKYDHQGKIASLGTPKFEIIKKVLLQPFFKKKYPKSLDRQDFNILFEMLKKEHLDVNDGMSTLLYLTVFSIIEALKLLPSKPKNLIIVGGGVKNIFLINIIKKELNLNVFCGSDLNLSSEMIEAELMGFLSARFLNKLPITFPLTTGVKAPQIGGKIYRKP